MAKLHTYLRHSDAHKMAVKYKKKKNNNNIDKEITKPKHIKNTNVDEI